MPLPSGGLIAAVRNRRQRAGINERQDEPLLVEDKRVFQERVLAIQDVLEDIESKILFNPSEKDPETSKEFMVDGLIEMAEAKINRSDSYKKLMGTTTFFILYIVLLFMQRDYEACYAIESSVMNLIVGKLPTTGSGGYTNSGVGANGFLSNVDEFYTWLNDALIKQVFNDPVCGDGKCDSPDEYPGFGRFGCIIDCGNYLNVTSLSINLEDVVQTSAKSLNWDLSTQSMIQDARKGGFKYNIYSQTMGNFLFETDRNDSKLVVDVPDGKFNLVLYQTVKTSELVDNAALKDLGIVPSTIPERNSLNDFSYGDKKEFITASYLLLSGIIDYCFSSEAMFLDPKCSNLNIPDVLFRVMASYGLNGSITSKTSTNSFDTVAEVLFCTSVPNRTGGIDSAENMAFFGQAETTCPAKVSRRARQQQVVLWEHHSEQAEKMRRKYEGSMTSAHSRQKDVGLKELSPTVKSRFPTLQSRSKSLRAFRPKQRQTKRQVALRSSSCTEIADQDAGYVYSIGSQGTEACYIVSLANYQNNLTFTVGVVNLGPPSSSTCSYGITACACTDDACSTECSSSDVTVCNGARPGEPTPTISIPSWRARVQVILPDSLASICATWGGQACPTRPTAATVKLVDQTVTTSCDGENFFVDFEIKSTTTSAKIAYVVTLCDSQNVCLMQPSCTTGPFYSNPTYANVFLETADVEGTDVSVLAIACSGTLPSAMGTPFHICVFPPPFLSATFRVVELNNQTFDANASFTWLQSALSTALNEDKSRIALGSAVLSQSADASSLSVADVTVKVFTSSNLEVVAVDTSFKAALASLLTGYPAAFPHTSLSLRSSSISSQLQTSGFYEACVTHYDCPDSAFCYRVPDAGYDFGVCLECSFCIVDSRDSYTGHCPQDKCPGSGGYPECIDASKILSYLDTNCKDNHEFEVWKFNARGKTPTVIPQFQPKVRELTPYNRMVGGIVISQRRRKGEDCSQGIQKPDVKAFTQSAKEGVLCPSEQQFDPKPFGYDATFMPFSSIYNGKLRPEMFYGPSERHAVNGTDGSSTLSFPKGFFPHEYDANWLDANLDGTLSLEELAMDKSYETVHEKDAKVVHGEDRNSFKLFFDERLTQKQAQAMVAFAKDGKFLDAQTQELHVEVVTFNAVKNLFLYLDISFKWETSGKIPWNYNIKTISFDRILYPSVVQAVLMLLVILFLAINCILEIMDIMVQARKFALHEYFADLFNWVDLLHFVFMWGTVVTWFVHRAEVQGLTLLPNYPILFYGPKYDNSTSRRYGAARTFEAPLSATKPASARMFRTNNQAEFDFLSLIHTMQRISSTMQVFSFFAGVSVVLFVLRMLKSLDFQERMGMVTRTISNAASDLWHFILLFLIVFMGYAIVGVLLFGHQFEGMKNLSSSCITLTIFLLNFDTTQFFSSMSHASDFAAFHIFLWSYLFIVFFILFNIFLAILVDAYANVKSHTDGSTGLISDFSSVVAHEVKRLVLPGSSFISNQRLKQRLLEEKERMQQMHKVKLDISKRMAYQRAILIRGGIKVDYQDLELFLGKTGGPRVHPVEGQAEGQEDGEEVGGMEDSEAIHNLLDRYGEDLSELQDRKNQDFKLILEIENMRRLLSMNALQNQLVAQQKRIVQVMEGIAQKSSVTIQEEEEEEDQEHLPRMDLVRSCDPYCILFLDGEGSRDSYMSKIIRKQVNPTWDEAFEWKVYSNSTIVTISVWDKDNITKDDLIGTAYLDISKLTSTFPDEPVALQIENPRFYKKLKAARIYVQAKVTKKEDVDVEVQDSEMLT
ncbi:hypothetical protein GUITHDRAFT_106834 [Guillardia theta CCMP2712]|uniref:C2 domain-containing protein n=1 Tax=Guillardia theta (strain CCMP2712) TaxID=905079 RepID=L1JFV1_GUITC|nr:hypothetical protein GUITHDRAFT_106834 [Guillardia theta CCMP2712]EKX47388.1 hypothetical protein GUITHDRAFT_106834 [Guillardia theta CCMP2712]|eukprot:XP_005834368.1 hypothetical protein GUITHDRAFT_106834 [Guillardia theta CCMP2712]